MTAAYCASSRKIQDSTARDVLEGDVGIGQLSGLMLALSLLLKLQYRN